MCVLSVLVDHWWRRLEDKKLGDRRKEGRGAMSWRVAQIV